MKRDYLTILEVADRLGVGYRQAYLIVRSQIPHYRVSRKDTRIPKAEFDAWVSRTIRPVRKKVRRKA